MRLLTYLFCFLVVAFMFVVMLLPLWLEQRMDEFENKDRPVDTQEQNKKDWMYLLLMYGIFLLCVAGYACIYLFGEQV